MKRQGVVVRMGGIGRDGATGDRDGLHPQAGPRGAPFTTCSKKFPFLTLFVASLHSRVLNMFYTVHYKIYLNRVCKGAKKIIILLQRMINPSMEFFGQSSGSFSFRFVDIFSSPLYVRFY